MNKIKWSKYIMAAVSIGFLVTALVGCGNNTQQVAAPQEIGGILQLYTSQPDTDVNKLVTAFKQKYPKVQVDVFRSGTEEVIARINTEIRAGKLGADVMMLADAPTFETLKNMNLLMPYQSPQAAGINQELLDSDTMYTPTKMIPIGIVVNTNKVKDLSAIDWNTLLTPENKGQVVMPSPLYSGAAAYLAGVFKNLPSFGWSYYQELKSREVMVVKGNGDVIKRVASGEKSYGIVVDFMAHSAREKGSPVAFIYPPSGVPVITEPVGIAKDTKNKEAAKAFVDFILSEEGQQLVISQGYLPVRDKMTVPVGRPSPNQLKVLAAPIKKLVEQRETDKNEFSALFGG